ncbi:hypothetical protein RLOatenuis_1750 [Rickettsiales bacterium]|nr:hypothetical protein RLOatenuis_1750 [Rickettsiales bacterium]
MGMATDFELLFARFAARNPDPGTELFSTNHYTLLVAVVLSAQATDVSVNKVTKRLFKIADTPEKMLNLGQQKLKQHIKTIGLFNNKAKNIVALSEILLERFSGKVPADFDQLLSLPGVGRKTAHVMLNCAFDGDNIAVDTHVFRVSNRIGIIKARNVQAAERALKKTIPKKWAKRAHHWLVLHGRYICKARNPACQDCFINDLCDYYRKSGLK